MLFAARYEKELPRNRFQPTAVDFYHYLIKVRNRRHYIRLERDRSSGTGGELSGVEGVDFFYFIEE